MREIKFRGYSKSFSMMFDYDMLEMATASMVDICKEKLKQVQPESMEIQMGLFLPTHDKDLILMQYTGLKDSNGKEIYEGDIVKIEDYFGEDRIGKIIYDETWACYCFMQGDEKRHFKTSLDLEDYVNIVIGNVYENPELLEKAKMYL